MLTEASACICGSGKWYAECCERFHKGEPAPTPEALMRARYCAFGKGLADYLLATWHPDTRPQRLDLADSPDWASLQILAAGHDGDIGNVHFRAIYRTGTGWGYLEEHSGFIRENGRWLYVSGSPREGQLKPGRNDPCPCGSGRKFKACCL